MSWTWRKSDQPGRWHCGCCGKAITTRGQQRHENNCRAKVLALQEKYGKPGRPRK